MSANKYQERRLEAYLIIASLVVYSVNRFTPIWSGEFAANHLNDLMAGVLLPAYINLVLSYSKYEFRVDRVSRSCMVGVLCCFSWELLAPLLLPFSTADLVDCACYFVGVFLHLGVMKLYFQ